MDKRKGICFQCGKFPRVLNEYYLTKEWMCRKCETQKRAEVRRSRLVEMIESSGFSVDSVTTTQDLEKFWLSYVNVSRYIADAFEELTGNRASHLLNGEEKMGRVATSLGLQPERFQRLANTQDERSEIANTRMRETSERQANDNYAYCYLAEHKPTIAHDDDFEEVERLLRQQFGSMIPPRPPPKHNINKTFLPPIPHGMRVLREEVAIVGITHRKDGVLRYCKGTPQCVRLQREAGNSHDPNAIQVIGSFQEGGKYQEVLLGYLPADIASRIVQSGQVDHVAALLHRLWVSETDYVLILIDIIHPA